MAKETEVLWSSEASGQLWNTCVWDLHSGTVEHTFKGGISASNCLCLVGKDYLLSAESGKPLLHHWPVCKKESKQTRIVVPGKVGVLKVSPDSNYCIATISERIHVWQLNSGRLLAILSAHYQPVRSIAFTSDSSHFLSAGDDAVLHCWSLASVVDKTCTVQTEPVWSSSNHSLPVTDIHVAALGDKSRAVTASLDQSARMYDTCTGNQIAVFMFDSGLSRVLLNASQSALYVGMLSGGIYKVNLHTRPVKTERHIGGASDHSTSSLFNGHIKEVTCLCLNLDGSLLASGSKDMTVRLWHTSSGQCIRTLPHKGAITNLFITQYPQALSVEKFKPSCCIKQLDRHLYNSKDDNEGIMELSIPALSYEEEDDISFCRAEAESLYRMSEAERQSFISGAELPAPTHTDNNHSDLLSELADTKRQLAQALAVNKQLYEFRVTQISSKPGKNSAVKLKSKTSNKSAR